MIPIVKRGTTTSIPVELELDMEDIVRIDFLFRQHMSDSEGMAVTKSWPEDVDLEDGVFYIDLNEDDTRVFSQESLFFLDTHPITENGHIVPMEIVNLQSYPTLFPPQEV